VISETENAVSVDHVSKTFKLPHEKTTSIKSAVVNFYRRKKSFEQQQVLKNISLDIKQGEFFGIIGRNGSGKSTLLKLLAGIYVPTDGAVHVRGKLTPFIELGVGFNPELTGRENVFLNGALLGFNHKEMHAMYKDIVSFAEIERFMDQKLKNYSSGMQVRLAFSIAIRAETDILLIDEVLAVGDAAFQAKCLEHFTKLKADGKTVVFVSHDTEAVRRFCDRAVLIEKGKIVVQGDTQKAIDEYLHLLTNKTDDNTPFGVETAQLKTANNIIHITKVWVEDDAGNETIKLTAANKGYTLAMEFKANQDVTNPVPGVVLRNREGLRVTATNTKWIGQTLGDIKAGQKRTVRFNFPNVLERGYYYVSANVVDNLLENFYHWQNDVVELQVEHGELTGGIVNSVSSVEIK
jgi:ABC-2 type transport system ATP-binding protein